MTRAKKITLETPWPKDLRERVEHYAYAACDLLDFLNELRQMLQDDPRAALPHPEFGTPLREWVEDTFKEADQLCSSVNRLDSDYFNPLRPRTEAAQ